MNDRQATYCDFGTLARRVSSLAVLAVMVMAVAFASLVTATSASASTTVFWEDFDGYNYFPDDHPAHDPVNFGVPLPAEGADKNWWGGRFEAPDHPISSDPIEDIYLDLAVQKWPGGSKSGPDPVARVGDDAGILFKVDTSNLLTAVLSFDWRLFSATSHDKLVVGYTTLDLDPFFVPFNDGTLTVSPSIATPGGGNTNLIADFFNEPTIGNGSNSNMQNWWANDWTQLMRANMNDWDTEVFAIPAGQSEVWIAFWIDNGDGDFAKLDNIHVSGQLVPEPSTWLMAVMGAVLSACVAIRRRWAGKKGRAAHLGSDCAQS